jgi:two-component system alkaline phosphatase synthesis response regulator PhoP
MSSRILLVEDEPGLVLTVSDLLTGAGYTVQTAADGEAGLFQACSQDFSVLILDVMLPKKSGFEVCRELRLKLGADDYLAKPFDPSELLARVEALLRRVRKENRILVRSFNFDDVEIDFEHARVTKAGQRVNIAAKELQLLRYLVHHRERVVPREELLEKVWEYNGTVSSRTIDVHVAWLRQKLDNSDNPKHIQTIRGKGYRFAP